MDALCSGAAVSCCSHRCSRASSTRKDWLSTRLPPSRVAVSASSQVSVVRNVVCNVRISESDEGSQLKEEDDARSMSREDLVRLIDEALQEDRDRDAVTLASNLRAFGKASMVPQRLYTLEDLRLNKIDATQLLSPTDKTLGDVKRTLQAAAIAGGGVLWWQLKPDQPQLLAATVLLLFLATVDQVANSGGVEALLLDTLGRVLSPKYQARVAHHESGHFLVSYLVGILPKRFTLSSLDAFRRHGALNVQAGTVFVDYDFQEEVRSGRLSSSTLNKFSCVALAGVASEYLRFEVAEGGLADVLQLDAILKGLQFSQKKADSQVRWAVLNTVSLLRRHCGLQGKLAAAMAAGKSVGECILLIERELEGSSDV